MINEMENKVSFDSVSDLEFGKNKLEMMRYRTNSLSYILGFLGIIFSLIAAFISLNSTRPQNPAIIIKIMMNIIILLGGFLCVEKVKAYSKNASITMMVIGGVCVARIFWYPLQIMMNYGKYVAALESGDSAASEEAKNYIGQTIFGYYEGAATRWFDYSGYTRGIVAIVLLSLAAAAFIASGIIGYIRSKKLTGYLASLEQKK